MPVITSLKWQVMKQRLSSSRSSRGATEDSSLPSTITTPYIPKSPEEEEFDVAQNITSYIENNLIGEENDSLVSMFQGVELPPISLNDYILRLIKFANIWTPEEDKGIESAGVRCAILAYEYLERSEKKFTPKSIHRYYACAFLLAIKFTEDDLMSSKFWANACGCTPREVNKMEARLCQDLKWNFACSVEEMNRQYSRFVV